MISSGKLEVRIFLMDQGKFRQYNWHCFVLRQYDKNKQIITKLGPAKEHFDNLTSINLFFQFPPLRQRDNTEGNSFLQRNKKEVFIQLRTKTSSLKIQIW
jgi:hypothetical protein